MEYYVNIKEAVTNLTNRIKLFSRVLTVIFMGLLLYSCANGDEIESDKTEEIAEYEDQIDEITDFIDKQTELEVNTFQTNLLAWLNNKNNIREATINSDKSLITVKFKNGVNFLINFQDMAIFDDEEEQNSVTCANISRAGKFFDYYDVSYQDDEKIIEQNKLLYIQGRNMTIGGILSNANKEKGLIEDKISESPIKCELITAPRTQFLTENLKDYGIILISQTHGIWGLNGAFQVEGDIKNIPVKYRLDVYTLYVQNNLIIQDTENKKYSTIMSDFLSMKLSGNQDAIIYGNYCWSFGLASKIKNTVYGYITEKPYYYFWDNMNIFLARMLNGDTFHNTYKDISGEIDTSEYNVIPNTNNPNSKQRYFSISTDEITNTNTNQPKISGKINGYENLKKDELTYLVYFHEGDADFSPESAKDDECIILKTPESPNLTNFSIDSKGKFSFDFPGVLMADTKYRITFAFKYKDMIYYGERKSIVPEDKDNTLTNGELIDLGLSVKWASCNLGASAPNQLGTMFNFDFKYDAAKNHPELFNEDGTKANFCESDYDYAYKLSAGRMRMPSYAELKELKEKCTWELAVIDDVAGVRIVGPNKNSIFMPTINLKTVSGYEEYKFTLYTLENTLYASGTYDRDLGPNFMSLRIAGIYCPQMPIYNSILNDLMSSYIEDYIRPVGK